MSLPSLSALSSLPTIPRHSDTAAVSSGARTTHNDTNHAHLDGSSASSGRRKREEEPGPASASHHGAGDISLSQWDHQFLATVNNEGEIKDTVSPDTFVTLIAEAREEMHQRLIAQVLSATRLAPKLRVIKAGALNYIKDWLKSALAKRSYGWLKEILKMMSGFPVDLPSFKSSKIGAIIKTIADSCDDIEAKGAAASLVKSMIKAADKAKKEAPPAPAPLSTSTTGSEHKATKGVSGAQEEREPKRLKTTGTEDEEGGHVETPMPTLAPLTDHDGMDLTTDAHPAALTPLSLSSMASLSALSSLSALTSTAAPGPDEDYFPAAAADYSFGDGGSVTSLDSLSGLDTDGAVDVDSEDEDDWGGGVPPANDGIGDCGIATEDMNGLIKVKGVGVPERYGDIKGGILKNRVRGVAGGRPLGQARATSGTTTTSTTTSSGAVEVTNGDVTSTSAGMTSARRGIAWIDTLPSTSAKELHEKVPKSTADAYQSSYLVAVKFFRKDAEPARISRTSGASTAAKQGPAAASTATAPGSVGGAGLTPSQAVLPGEESDEEDMAVSSTGLPLLLASGSEGGGGVPGEEKHKKFAEALSREKAGEHDSVKTLLTTSKNDNMANMRNVLSSSARGGGVQAPRGPEAALRFGVASPFPVATSPHCVSRAPWAAHAQFQYLKVNLPEGVKAHLAANEIESVERDAQARATTTTQRVAYPSRDYIPRMPAVSPGAFLHFSPTHTPRVLEPVPVPPPHLMAPVRPSQPPPQPQAGVRPGGPPSTAGMMPPLGVGMGPPRPGTIPTAPRPPLSGASSYPYLHPPGQAYPSPGQGQGANMPPHSGSDGFAHSGQQGQRRGVAGTKMCAFFTTPRGCKNGAACPFRHDESYVATPNDLALISGVKLPSMAAPSGVAPASGGVATAPSTGNQPPMHYAPPPARPLPAALQGPARPLGMMPPPRPLSAPLGRPYTLPPAAAAAAATAAGGGNMQQPPPGMGLRPTPVVSTAATGGAPPTHAYGYPTHAPPGGIPARGRPLPAALMPQGTAAMTQAAPLQQYPSYGRPAPAPMASYAAPRGVGVPGASAPTLPPPTATAHYARLARPAGAGAFGAAFGAPAKR